MQKDFERCCHFLAQMMEKYGAEVLRDIAVEIQYEPELLGLNFIMNIIKIQLIALVELMM